MEGSSCVIYGTEILIDENSGAPIESFKVGDFVLGNETPTLYKFYEIEQIIISNGEPIYTFTLDNGLNLSCSESHCLFIPVKNTSISAYKLQKGDSLLTKFGAAIITDITIGEPQPVIGLRLKDGGCYYANNILSHSQLSHPSMVLKTLGISQSRDFVALISSSESNLSDIKIIDLNLKPFAQDVISKYSIYYKYPQTNWRKITSLINNSWQEMNMGYAVNSKGVSLKINFAEIDDYKNSFLFVSFVGDQLSVALNGNELTAFHQVKLNEKSHMFFSLTDVIAHEMCFEVSSSNNVLLTNFDITSQLDFLTKSKEF